MRRYLPFLFLALFLPRPAMAETCTVGFDDAFALYQLRGPSVGGGTCTLCEDYPGHPNGQQFAANTFTYFPWYSAQKCGTFGQATTAPAGPGGMHYHLGFTDPTINCIDYNTGWMGRGRYVGDSQCKPITNPLAEKRTLSGHDANQWTFVFVKGNDGVTNKVLFRPVSIRVTSGKADIWFHTTGGWQRYPNLPARNIDLSAIGWCYEMELGTSVGEGGPATFDDLVIHN